MCLCCSPLLFGLEIKEDFEVLNSYKFQSKDYQITPKSTWNYALRLQDDHQPQQDLRVVYSGLEIGVSPFSLKGAPIMIIAEVCPAVTVVLGNKQLLYTHCRGGSWTHGNWLTWQQNLLLSPQCHPLHLYRHSLCFHLELLSSE